MPGQYGVGDDSMFWQCGMEHHRTFAHDPNSNAWSHYYSHMTANEVNGLPHHQSVGYDKNSVAAYENVNEDYAKEITDEHSKAEDNDDHAMAVYCKECQSWMNGQRQYEDHKTGKKHQKNLQKARRGNVSVEAEVVKEKVEKVMEPDPVPEIITDTWLWLQKGKEDKEQEELQKQANGKEQKMSRSARRRRHKKLKELEETENCVAGSVQGRDNDGQDDESKCLVKLYLKRLIRDACIDWLHTTKQRTCNDLDCE